MELTKEAFQIVERTFRLGNQRGYEYITPEYMLLTMCDSSRFVKAFQDCGGKIELLVNDLEAYLEENVEQKIDQEVEAEFSLGLQEALETAENSAHYSGKGAVELSHLLHGLFQLQDCYAVYFMKKQGVEENHFQRALSSYLEEESHMKQVEGTPLYGDEPWEEQEESAESIMDYAPCLNDTLVDENPLIGRETEIERTIQILCRKDKNNALHIGEPGVGKTAITYGLVRRINEGKVPESLKGARVFALDLGSTIAGTQYRGEFEKRLKQILNVIQNEEKPIVYIDEIHNLLGAGAVGESSFDAANILKPYLSEGKIRFMGATTFEEYKRYFEKSKSLVRRFQNVEILEPSVEETTAILEGLKKHYEKYHGVVYGKGVLEYAATMSAKYIQERFLPDKAIDLLDEAGAYRKIHPLEQKKQTVGKDLIDEVLTKICRVPKQSVETDDAKKLASLETRLCAKVFGQDEAIKQVVNAVKFSKAGLLEDHKPLASLLFVGPTGVGKTEIAKTLAAELGVHLIRFDMSEYGEKHAVSKLIGAPAGYVGYEDGGLLTEEVRKHPSAVLLLDEIEKAHPDIFSTLLQVMDYATLTDNQGRKADFRNVIIIMTSNAGATRMGKMGMGFQAKDASRETLLEEVKRVFQPEFRNRLNGIVAFREISDGMAKLIVEKKLGEMVTMLEVKKITFTYEKEAVALIQKQGVSKEYGAREIDRIIQNQVKPLLVDEILFGKLKKGGKCKLVVKKDKFQVLYS